MNTTPLHDFKIPGFQVVSKNELCDIFSPDQSAYYVLLRRRTTPEEPHEAVLFVHYVDHFLDACQRQIDELWSKHGVPITHVAVKLGAPLRRAHDFAEAYTRALNVQKLRHELQPRFRRL